MNSRRATAFVSCIIFVVSNAAADELHQRLLVQLEHGHFQLRSHVQDLAFSADGKVIAAAEANSPARIVRLFDVASGEQTRVLADPDRKPGWVSVLAFSPDGTSLLCGELDGRVTLWDWKSGAVLARKTTHNGDVRAVAYSPDGKWWATADDTGRIELRSASDGGKSGRILALGVKTADLLGGFSEVASASICFSADSRKLIVAVPKSRGSIAIIDVATATRLATVNLVEQVDRFSPSVNYIRLMPDGKSFLSAGRRTVPRSETSVKFGAKNVPLTQLKLWDVATGEHIRDLHEKDQHGFGYAALSPDGNHVVVSDFALLSCRDTQRGEVVWKTSLPGIWGSTPVYSPDGKLIAISHGASLLLFDAQTGQQKFPDGNRGGNAISASWSNDGIEVVVGHGDGFVRIWNAQNGELLWEQEFAAVISPSGRTAKPEFVSFSADSQKIIVAGERDDPEEYRTGLIRGIDRETRGTTFQRTFDRSVKMGAISHDKKTVAVATNNGSLGKTHLYGVDTTTGDLRFSVFNEAEAAGLWNAEAIAFDAQSEHIRIATGNSEIVTFRTLTGEEVNRVSVDWRTDEQKAANKPRLAQLWNGHFSNDASRLTSSSHEYLYLWDSATGRRDGEYLMPHLKGCKVAFSLDGSVVATSDLQYAGDYGDDVLRLYDAGNGKQILQIPLDDRRVTLLRFSPDGSRLFTGLTRGGAAIWDVTREASPRN